MASCSASIPLALRKAIDEIYIPSGLTVTKEPVREEDNLNYSGGRVELDGALVVFREAKVTPKKIGLFVAIWKKSSSENVPLDVKDGIRFVVISCSEGLRRGQFIFDKEVLVERKILSVNEKGGKLGFRVYPPWSVTTSKTAQATQLWQTKYFLEIKKSGIIDFNKARTLLKV